MGREKSCRLFLSCAALTGCLGAPVFAADLSVRAPVNKAPTYRQFTWTGFYGGLHLGYIWGNQQISSLITAFVEPAPGVAGGTSSQSAGTSSSSRSPFGGFQAGYNLQAGSLVYGVETDVSVTRLQASGPALAISTRAFTGNDTASLQTSSNPIAGIDWFGTLRARLGFAWDRMLIYGTGGLAYGSVRVSDGTFFNGFAGSDNTAVAFNVPGTSGGSVVKGGWTAGAGIDYAYTDNIILSFTYLHVDLGSGTIFSKYRRPNNILGGASTTVVRGWTLTSTDFDLDAVRFAASWKF